VRQGCTTCAQTSAVGSGPPVRQRFKLEELGPGYRMVAAWPASRRVVQWR